MPTEMLYSFFRGFGKVFVFYQAAQFAAALHAYFWGGSNALSIVSGTPDGTLLRWLFPYFPLPLVGGPGSMLFMGGIVVLLGSYWIAKSRWIFLIPFAAILGPWIDYWYNESDWQRMDQLAEDIDKATGITLLGDIVFFGGWLILPLGGIVLLWRLSR